MNDVSRGLYRRMFRFLGLSLGLIAASVFAIGSAQAKDYGKPGEPIHLTIGYQPYYTQAWSAVILKYKKFWEKYLPKGSTVSWSVGLQGSIVGNGMLAGKNDIGYMGDMPSIATASKKRVNDIRIVATLGLAADQCSVILVRKSAPHFANTKEALNWLNDKRLAVAKGSCTDRTAQAIMKEFKLKPAAYLNQNIEVQTSGLRSDRIDGSVMWEPTASKIMLEGIGRPIADAGTVHSLDGGFLAMPYDLIKQRPDVVKAWLNAELDADLYKLDPKNVESVIDMAKKDTTGFSKQVLWMSFVGQYPKSMRVGYRDITYFGFDDKVLGMIDSATSFLHGLHAIGVAKLPEGTVMPEFTAAILKERGLTAPVGKVMPIPTKDCPYGAITLPAAPGEQ